MDKMEIKLVGSDESFVAGMFSGKGPLSEFGTMIQYFNGDGFIGIPLWRVEWVKLIHEEED